ncbi:MAG: ATP-grasp domain-containing protein [Candidatus Hatepunaea meridiana]|nr:ATP-grasp domain-containing protein [Candidatus Hatepunaea meridiana]
MAYRWPDEPFSLRTIINIVHIMNILFTCAGRRNYLIQYFKVALKSDEKVIAVDSSRFAPALQEADQGFLVPLVDDPNYLNILLEICRDNRVGFLIPLNDLELPLLAQHHKKFTAIGTIPLVSSQDVIDICFDKWRTIQFCTNHGLRTPATYLDLVDAKIAIKNDELSFPLVLKPRWGSASISIEYVYDDDELETAYKLVKKRIFRMIIGGASAADAKHAILIQEKLQGQEYGLDVVNDLNGNYQAVFAKLKIAMRAGETDKAETVDDPALTDVGRRIGENLKHIGNLDCDVFMSESDICILEMNPRFGGGYPFSHYAGANLPAALTAWVRGEEVRESWLSVKPGVFSAKCDHLVGWGSFKKDQEN